MLNPISFRSNTPPASSQLAISQVSLTAKEKDVLTWSAMGKSSWEIALIVGCSESGVNFHFCNIRRKFDVSSRRTAILMALRMGLLDLG